MATRSKTVRSKSKQARLFDRPSSSGVGKKKSGKRTKSESRPAARTRRKPSRNRETAVSMGGRQREISISEFFTKNRHLLGFDSPRKALLTAVKEAVDNSLDACEEAGILPDLIVEIEEISD